MLPGSRGQLTEELGAEPGLLEGRLELGTPAGIDLRGLGPRSGNGVLELSEASLGSLRLGTDSLGSLVRVQGRGLLHLRVLSQRRGPGLEPGAALEGLLQPLPQCGDGLVVGRSLAGIQRLEEIAALPLQALEGRLSCSHQVGLDRLCRVVQDLQGLGVGLDAGAVGLAELGLGGNSVSQARLGGGEGLSGSPDAGFEISPLLSLLLAAGLGVVQPALQGVQRLLGCVIGLLGPDHGLLDGLGLLDCHRASSLQVLTSPGRHTLCFAGLLELGLEGAARGGHPIVEGGVQIIPRGAQGSELSAETSEVLLAGIQARVGRIGGLLSNGQALRGCRGCLGGVGAALLGRACRQLSLDQSITPGLEGRCQGVTLLFELSLAGRRGGQRLEQGGLVNVECGEPIGAPRRGQSRGLPLGPGSSKSLSLQLTAWCQRLEGLPSLGQIGLELITPGLQELLAGAGQARLLLLEPVEGLQGGVALLRSRRELCLSGLEASAGGGHTLVASFVGLPGQAEGLDGLVAAGKGILEARLDLREGFGPGSTVFGVGGALGGARLEGGDGGLEGRGTGLDLGAKLGPPGLGRGEGFPGRSEGSVERSTAGGQIGLALAGAVEALLEGGLSAGGLLVQLGQQLGALDRQRLEGVGAGLGLWGLGLGGLGLGDGLLGLVELVLGSSLDVAAGRQGFLDLGTVGLSRADSVAGSRQRGGEGVALGPALGSAGVGLPGLGEGLLGGGDGGLESLDGNPG